MLNEMLKENLRKVIFFLVILFSNCVFSQQGPAGSSDNVLSINPNTQQMELTLNTDLQKRFGIENALTLVSETVVSTRRSDGLKANTWSRQNDDGSWLIFYTVLNVSQDNPLYMVFIQSFEKNTKASIQIVYMEQTGKDEKIEVSLSSIAH